jgi:hypothetical protein
VSLNDGFTSATRIAAGMLIVGGLVALLTIRHIIPPDEAGAAPA